MSLARKHEITRLEAFSDAVFAFALTLLVVMVGLLSIAWALAAPGRLVAFAGFVYFLMAPVQTLYGSWSGRRRRAYERPHRDRQG